MNFASSVARNATVSVPDRAPSTAKTRGSKVSGVYTSPTATKAAVDYHASSLWGMTSNCSCSASHQPDTHKTQLQVKILVARCIDVFLCGVVGREGVVGRRLEEKEWLV